MRFVPVKTAEQQAALSVHRTRALLVRQRTKAANALRAVLSEFGIVAAQEYEGLRELMARLEEPSEDIPENMRGALQTLAGHWQVLDADERGSNGRSPRQPAAIEMPGGGNVRYLCKRPL